jgi:hypothetical protein
MAGYLVQGGCGAVGPCARVSYVVAAVPVQVAVPTLNVEEYLCRSPRTLLWSLATLQRNLGEVRLSAVSPCLRSTAAASPTQGATGFPARARCSAPSPASSSLALPSQHPHKAQHPHHDGS